MIGAAIEVHRNIGPGFLETVYEEALAVEMKLQLGLLMNFNSEMLKHNLKRVVLSE